MIDHVALLPAYLAAATAVAVLLADLVVPGRRAVPLAVAAVGAAATAVGATWLGLDIGNRFDTGGARSAFCGGRTPPGGAEPAPDCSYLVDARAAALMVVFALLTLGVIALSVAVSAPAGEYAFLLTCSMTGGVVLAGAADLITLIVAVETLTLPLYVLVGLWRTGGERAVRGADAAVTFLVVSVVSTAVTLLGAALLYATTGAVHFGLVTAAFATGTDPALQPLAIVGTVLLVGGLGFKVAAVPLHAWAPATYDGAPLPVAAYLSTASKLGGVVAIAYVVTEVVPFHRDVAVAALVVLSLLTMTVGNLVALRQVRMVRLLAWSSIAQAGYILAALIVPDGVTAALAYTVFFVTLELAAFAALIALRGPDDGGGLVDYAGSARRSPLRSGAFLLALCGLAGLPPGIAGLFAKVFVVRALITGGATWMAIVVAVNAVIGLAYYLRAGGALFGAASIGVPAARPGRTVAAVLAVVTLLALAIGLAPQLVLDAVAIR